METTQNFITTTTTAAAKSGTTTFVGFLLLAISILFYGSFLLPVKKLETGDGMFFQLVLCMGIWVVAFVVNLIQNSPKFYALPMVCGIMWTTGNITSVPIVKFIGLALGMLIWGVISLICGWANARFGIFGNKAQVPQVIWMNYVGVSLAILSAFVYLFVKPEMNKSKVDANNVQSIGLEDSDKFKEENLTLNNKDTSILEKINPKLRRVLGIIMAIFAGVMYGFGYAPILYVIDNYENSSSNGLDYVFPFYTGTLISSIVYFLIYCAIKKNKPIVYENAILPGAISGLMWGIANCCFLVASTTLSQSVTFPIGASGPPVIASLIGIVFYKEVRGKRNLLILSGGFLLTLTGAIFSGLSNEKL